MFKRVLLCGVGGQGTILAAHLLADAAMRNGYDVKVSEIHGMAQRGGSVTTVVTLGDEVLSMVSGKGEADLLVSFDMLEALRYADELKTDGAMIVSSETIMPMAVLTGKAELPRDMRGKLDAVGAYVIPAEEIARESGSEKTFNVVMLGALSPSLDIPVDVWKESVSSLVPPKTVDMNLKAFDAGREFAIQSREG